MIPSLLVGLGRAALGLGSKSLGNATRYGIPLRNAQTFLGTTPLALGAADYGIGKYNQSRANSENARTSDAWRKFRDAETKSQERKGYTDFVSSMESSVKDSVSKAASESDSDIEDPFNYNQLFIASILKGLKQKPPTTHSGKGAGTYIPKPDLPKMSDYDSNKTYWNIG
jgi:hypothetical protein